jgi:hypothetical protein
LLARRKNLRYDRDGSDDRDERMRSIDEDALADESVAETQSMLNALRGKTVGLVVAEKRRIVIETTDGNRFYFSGMATA